MFAGAAVPLLVPVSSEVGLKRLQKILTGTRHLSVLEMCILPACHRTCRTQMLNISTVTDVLCLASRSSVPIDGEVISVCCSPVTKTVALQLANRQILKYLWGKLRLTKIASLGCSYYRFL